MCDIYTNGSLQWATTRWLVVKNQQKVIFSVHSRDHHTQTRDLEELSKLLLLYVTPQCTDTASYHFLKYNISLASHT